MARVFVNTNGISREEWLNLRRQGIGGSDAGAIVGLSRFVTPYTVWADKTGRLPEREDSEAMRQGRDLEGYVASRFEEETGKKVRRRNVMFQHDQHDFILANIDREVVGERAGLECKTTSMMNLRQYKNGEYPDAYYTQCVHYLAVTGWERWYLAVLVLNQGFYVFTIERDEEEIAALVGAEVDFWNQYVATDTAPDPDGYKPTSDAQDKIYQGGEQEPVDIYRTDIIENYIALKTQIKALEQEKEKCEQIIKEDLKDAEIGLCGPWRVTWQTRQRKTFDAKRLEAERPDLDLSGFYKTSTYRTFAIKEEKKGEK